MHGAGNDFILIDNYDNKIKEWNSEFIKNACRIHTGIGADGFIVLEKDSQYDFKMRFFNADGIEAEMCVNGSRCLCYFAYSLGYVTQEMRFGALDGSHYAKVYDKEVEVEVNNKELTGDKGFPDDYILPQGIKFKSFLDTGVPHLILDVENIDDVDVAKLGRDLRNHPFYQPKGTNVNFVKQSDNKNELRIRTYERGVEAETKACGTGSTAAAIAYLDKNVDNEKIKVITNGGLLNVKISDNFRKIYLRGPVKEVFKGIYSLEG